MIIRIEEGFVKAEPAEDTVDFVQSETYFDNIDHARAYISEQLQGKDWTAEHPGMVIDTYIYDKQYFPNSRKLRFFSYIRAERF